MQDVDFAEPRGQIVGTAAEHTPEFLARTVKVPVVKPSVSSEYSGVIRGRRGGWQGRTEESDERQRNEAEDARHV
jgi:hypothetical protein